MLREALTAGAVTFSEFAYNYMLTLAFRNDPEGIERCVNALPDDIAVSWYEYLNDNLADVDFMPCPRPFMTGSPSDEAITVMKQKLRNRYVRIYELVQNRIALWKKRGHS